MIMNFTRSSMGYASLVKVRWFTHNMSILRAFFKNKKVGRNDDKKCHFWGSPVCNVILKLQFCTMYVVYFIWVWHNASVLRTTYAVYALKNLWQICHMVCTKQMVIAPFYNLLAVQVYPRFSCSLCFRLTHCIFLDCPSSLSHSLTLLVC